jgi:hypothetical protein
VIQLEGNTLIERGATPQEDALCKEEHEKRVAALAELLPLLARQEHNLTVADFLTATYKDLRQDEQGHLLDLKLATPGFEPNMTVRLTHRAFVYFDMLRFKGKAVEREYEEVLPYLRAGITPKNLPREINNLQLPQYTSHADIPRIKNLCKQVLNYHQDAGLKGQLTQLIRYSIFSSQKMTKVPSLLFPETNLTLEKGQVYLIANNKGIENEHARLAYEYLTGNGQHLFCVAHLQHNPVKNESSIYFEGGPANKIPEVIPWLPRGRLIAKYSADTRNIKKMHFAIRKDAALLVLPEKKFQLIIFGSSQSDKIMNCLIYCIRKMKKHLGIDVPIDKTDCLPSTVVRKEIEKSINSAIGELEMEKKT